MNITIASGYKTSIPEKKLKKFYIRHCFCENCSTYWCIINALFEPEKQTSFSSYQSSFSLAHLANSSIRTSSPHGTVMLLKSSSGFTSSCNFCNYFNKISIKFYFFNSLNHFLLTSAFNIVAPKSISPPDSWVCVSISFLLELSVTSRDSDFSCLLR